MRKSTPRNNVSDGSALLETPTRSCNKSKRTSDNKRITLIVSCIVLIVVCILTLPNCCSSDSDNRGRSPEDSLPEQPRSKTAWDLYSSYSNESGGSGSPINQSGGSGSSVGLDDNSGIGLDDDWGNGVGLDDVTPVAKISFFAILFVSYIVARIKSKKDELVITANGFDKIFILLAPILYFVGEITGGHSPLSITLYSISATMLLASIYFSIKANSKNWLNIVLSILAKLFIFVLTIIILILIIVWLMISIFSHSTREETFIVKYDYWLDQWVCYRAD